MTQFRTGVPPLETLPPGPRRRLPSHVWIVAVLLGLGALLRIGHLGFDPVSLARNGPAVDDSYYYFGIARNLLSGLGVTHDGVHPTAGFHPAWMAIVVAVTAIAGPDPYLPVAATLYLQVLLALATGIALFRVARRVSGVEGALFAVLAWSVMPPFVVESINGLETGLACLAAVLGLGAHLSAIVPSNGRPPLRTALAVGALYGFLILCRLDLGLLAAILGGHWLLLVLRSARGEKGQPARALAAATLAGVLVVTPWFAFVHAQTGGLLPESGAATRTIALAYGTRPGEPDTVHGDMESPNADFYAAQILAGVRETLTRPTWWPVTAATTALRETGLIPGGAKGLGVTGGVLALAWFGWRMVRRRRGTEVAAPGARVVGPLVLLVSVGYVTAYSLFVFGSWWFQRYYMPMMTLWMLYSALPLQRSFDAIRRQSSDGKARLAAILLATGALTWSLAGREAQQGRMNPTAPYWEMAELVDRILPEGTRLGAFQSGTLAYASRHTVINLDGVVNGDAAAAVREGRVLRYAMDEGVDCILDWPHVLQDLLVLRSQPDPAVRLRPVARGSMDLLCLEKPSGP